MPANPIELTNARKRAMLPTFGIMSVRHHERDAAIAGHDRRFYDTFQISLLCLLQGQVRIAEGERPYEPTIYARPKPGLWGDARR